jgi:cyclophilin family peptidyl-prolyl cis-trans isomerase
MCFNLYCDSVLCRFFSEWSHGKKSGKPGRRPGDQHGGHYDRTAPGQGAKTVANFLEYVNSGFYKDTIFHRVIKGFMIQGGGLTAGLEQKPTRPPVENEAANGEKNMRGAVAMARTSEIHSATAQFFINTVNNPFLDHRSNSPEGFGYCVFGRVTGGMEVVDKIESSATGNKGMQRDVPIQPVIIKDVRLKD